MSEHTHHHDVLADLNPKHRVLRKMIPDVYRGFAELSGAALTPVHWTGKPKSSSRWPSVSRPGATAA